LVPAFAKKHFSARHCEQSEAIHLNPKPHPLSQLPSISRQQSPTPAELTPKPLKNSFPSAEITGKNLKENSPKISNTTTKTFLKNHGGIFK